MNQSRRIPLKEAAASNQFLLVIGMRAGKRSDRGATGHFDASAQELAIFVAGAQG
jgi:hypothetical protein